MIFIMTLFLAVSSMSYDKVETNNISFIFKTDDRHLNNNFIKCKTLPVTYVFLKEDAEILETIISNTPKEKKSYIYLGIKHPYKTKYYFKRGDNCYFSIEGCKGSSFLITIINPANKVFLLISTKSENNKFIKQIIDRIDKL